jgi:hypothetical protein
MGKTIIDATGVADRSTDAAGGNYLNQSAAITLGAKTSNQRTTGILLQDFTLVGPTSLIVAGPSPSNGHAVWLVNSSDFILRRIETVGFVGETIIYTMPDNLTRAENIEVDSCIFRDCYYPAASIQVNYVSFGGVTRRSRNVRVHNCLFRNIYVGVGLDGQNIQIDHNVFDSVVAAGVALGDEDSNNGTCALEGSDISHNLFLRLGYGRNPAGTNLPAGVVGIGIAGDDRAYRSPPTVLSQHCAQHISELVH